MTVAGVKPSGRRTVAPAFVLARQKAILDALEIRFAHVPDGLREAIDTINDETRLRSLLQAAIQAASLEDFARSL